MSTLSDHRPLLVENASEEVTKLREELLSRIKGSYPVVYAVRIEGEWLQSGSVLEREVRGSLVDAPINLPANDQYRRPAS